MTERKDQLVGDRALRMLDRHWKWVTLAAWVILSAWFLYNRWSQIQTFTLVDTDDNMRISQVRALLHGQDWYDLRQYKLNPPTGANIHWSRLVDLPLAGLILLFRPLIGGIDAERVAIAVAPLLPYLLLLFGIALTARRLIHPAAYILAFIALFTAGSTNGMFMPTRIDHHGWQLAFLSIADRRLGRSQTSARRGDPRHCDRTVVGHRARAAHLPGARRGRDRAVLGRRPRREAAPRGLCGDPRRRHGPRLRPVRLLRQPPRGV